MKVQYLAEGSQDCPLIRFFDAEPEACQRLKCACEQLSLEAIKEADLTGLPGMERVEGCRLLAAVSRWDRGVTRCGDARPTPRRRCWPTFAPWRTHDAIHVSFLAAAKLQRFAMSHIILDQRQAELLTRGGKTLQVRDQQGRLVGFIEPAPSEEEIAIARARRDLDEPEYTTAEVLDQLRTLQKQ